MSIMLLWCFVVYIYVVGGVVWTGLMEVVEGTGAWEGSGAATVGVVAAAVHVWLRNCLLYALSVAEIKFVTSLGCYICVEECGCLVGCTGGASIISIRRGTYLATKSLGRKEDISAHVQNERKEPRTTEGAKDVKHLFD